MAAKREKVSAAKVPVLLFAVATNKDLNRAVDKGHLRGAKDDVVEMFERRSRAVKDAPASHVILRIAAQAAARAGCSIYKGAGGRYETAKVPLGYISCSRLPRAIRGVTRVDAAGGVVLTEERRPRVLLLFKGKGKRGSWVLPKGKRRRMEVRRRAARREVLEETGLARVEVGQFVLRECYFDVAGREVIFKEVSYYLMRCPKGKERLKVRKAEGFDRGKWATFDDALATTNPVRAYRALRKARSLARSGSARK